MDIRWEIKFFNDLSPEQLYKILQLRNEIFVVEQKCIYQDADNKDQPAFHLMGTNENDELVAYSRILPEGISYNEASIGRIVTSRNVRQTGIGKQLMLESIRQLYHLFGKIPIRISAQLYLEKFYCSFSFQTCSEVYLEDEIPHIEMLLL